MAYESPVTLLCQQVADAITQDQENKIMAEIKYQMAVDINKEELLKALKYDRDQYNKGYNDGYLAGAQYAMDEMQKRLNDACESEIVKFFNETHKGDIL